MVEIYEGENLFTAYRFWVLPEEKKANNELGLYMLSRCSINATEEKCNADEACESFYFKPEKYNDQEVFVCEAR